MKLNLTRVQRENLLVVEKEIIAAGISRWSVDKTVKGHTRVRIYRGGNHRTVVFGHNGDPRIRNNIKADTRRVIHELTQTTERRALGDTRVSPARTR